MLGTTTATTTATTHMLLLHDSLQGHTLAQLPFHMADSPPQPKAEFCAATCLFCNSTSAGLEANYQHMQKHHGLFIHDAKHLIIDMETLLGYLHLIIFEHKECLHCHTTRRSVQAVQQHMTGTGHCKFDIYEEGSEFREFYDFDDSDSLNSDEEPEPEEQEEGQLQPWRNKPSGNSSMPVQVDDTSMRLPSGRIVSNRSAPAPRHPSRRPLKPPASGSSSRISFEPVTNQPATSGPSTAGDGLPSPEEPRIPSSKALAKKERQASALSAQLSSLRANDQRALSHLAPAERRALLTQALRKEAQSDRAENKFRGRMDKLGNVQSKARFVNDVPGGKSHKNRFLAQ